MLPGTLQKNFNQVLYQGFNHGGDWTLSDASKDLEDRGYLSGDTYYYQSTFSAVPELCIRINLRSWHVVQGTI
jgi:hypothetical protein